MAFRRKKTKKNVIYKKLLEKGKSVATYTEEDLIALRSAIKLGAMEVEYKDKRIKYRSLADMLSIEKLITAQLGLVATSRPTRLYASVSKGVR